LCIGQRGSWAVRSGGGGLPAVGAWAKFGRGMTHGAQSQEADAAHPAAVGVQGAGEGGEGDSGSVDF
jgi:hypothetical protein